MYNACNTTKPTQSREEISGGSGGKWNCSFGEQILSLQGSRKLMKGQITAKCLYLDDSPSSLKPTAP
jgi:hypothetical protein